MEHLYYAKRKGVILITTLLMLIIMSMLLLNLLTTQRLHHKMQSNYQTKLFSQQQAENNLVLAENAIKAGQLVANDNRYQWQRISCDEGTCYLITAKGFFAQTQTVLQESYVLKSLPQSNGHVTLQTWRLGWHEIEH